MSLAGQILTSSGQPAAFLRIEIRGQQARFPEDCSGQIDYDRSIGFARVATDSAGNYRALLPVGDFCLLIFARHDMVFEPIMPRSEFRVPPPPPIDAVLPAGGTWEREGLPPSQMP